MKSAKQLLKSKLKDRTARIGVIGLGYVGLPFAVEKAKVGFNVTGWTGTLSVWTRSTAVRIILPM